MNFKGSNSRLHVAYTNLRLSIELLARITFPSQFNIHEVCFVSSAQVGDLVTHIVYLDKFEERYS